MMSQIAWSVIFLSSTVICVFLYKFSLNPKREIFKKILLAFLGSIASLSLLNYCIDLSSDPKEWKKKFRMYWTERSDPYDLMFYYVNTKYFKEIGYFDLYPLLIHTAYRKNLAPFLYKSDRVQLQDKDGYYWSPFEELVRDKGRYKQIRDRFSPTRWDGFLKDIKILLQKDQWESRRWINFFWDHGFNGSPTWIALFTPITNIIPIQSVKLLCLLDAALLFFALLWIGKLYGLFPAFISITFLFNSFATEWPDIGLVFGRYDFVAFLIFTFIFLDKNKALSAGLAFGLAAAFRYLPLFALPLLAFRVLGSANEPVSASTKLTRNFLAISLATFLFGHIAASLLYPTINETFYYKMTSHGATEYLTRGKLGFQLALSWDGSFEQKKIGEERKSVIAARSYLSYLLATILSLLILPHAYKRPVKESIGLSILLVYLWLMPSYHYYILFLLPLLSFATSERIVDFITDITALLMIETMVATLRFTIPDSPVSITSAWCCAIGAYVLYLSARSSQSLLRATR